MPAPQFYNGSRVTWLHLNLVHWFLANINKKKKLFCKLISLGNWNNMLQKVKKKLPQPLLASHYKVCIFWEFLLNF